MCANTFRSVPVLFGLFLAACGGGAAAEPVRTAPEPPPPPTPVHARGDDEVVATVGRAGGSLELASGWRIEFPEGALDADVEVRFVRGHPANVFDPEEGETGVGEIAELTPMVVAADGRLIRVSAPTGRTPSGFEESSVVLGMEEETRGRTFGDAVTTRWQYHRGVTAEGRYVAEVAYLGGHRLQFGLLREE